MKKPNNAKNSPAKKNEKGKETGDAKKTPSLKPLKEKEKKSWKNSLNEEDEDEDFTVEDDIKLTNFDDDDEEEDDFYDDKF